MKKAIIALLSSALVLGTMGGNASAAEVNPTVHTSKEQIKPLVINTHVSLKKGESKYLPVISARYSIKSGYYVVSLSYLGKITGLSRGIAQVYGYDRRGIHSHTYNITVSF
ncbi:hypothetical protein [Paenibacillus sp. 481]|uniref:hypothetical protein n=1 Tax=Paenibacillus sp. 481 TaxID=2835869 RepID=UPI001E5B29DB|nr:hypothetical protein [Paenibacillus sp. 481]UHA73132.1 hypothetical protein KIK04_21455 [Paenibacillus sp. 481]